MSTESIGLSVTILVSLATATGWLLSKIEKEKDKNHDLELEIKNLELKIKELENKISLQNTILENVQSNTNTFISLLEKLLK
ncbi:MULTISPECIES: hypothetical protein [Capnocytophaga]|jgi:hypothetical protein|uniref:hypothetical protein n=1 Tax=Capnocytophaga sp. oral taxon 863 TaxID=1227265 RepID=UPI000395E584|nr:hypothetical protein [Capnocytophaga sp. oral taxon 863]ERI63508.1 hypothetical protein HMPREF1551_01185 [Capnocytophaga sp. oral taxon 863 str. F0517]